MSVETTEPSPLDPERIGPFLVLRSLGAGAMGSVSLVKAAEDLPYATAGTRLALKQLHPSLSSHPILHERFIREGRIGMSVRHPCVVATLAHESYPIGDGARGQFLVLEYVEGQPLDALIRQMRTIPEALLLDIAVQLARGLAAIHAAGAIHRDVKPANILITPDHRVKLSDLGVAHSDEEGIELTALGGFVGSPAYASPEQFGDAEVTPASDLYSLGCVLWEAAAGRRAFQGRDIPSVMQQQLALVPDRLGAINPEISNFLEELVATLLEKDPSRRIASALELADILEQAERSRWWTAREAAAAAGGTLPVRRRPRVDRGRSLVGRDEPLARLEESWAEACAGRGGVFVLEGEAGVGKSRLVEELVAKVEGGPAQAIILWGSAPPGGTGRGPLADALLQHFGDARLDAALQRYLPGMPRVLGPLAASIRRDAIGGDPLPAIVAEAAWCELASSLSRQAPLLWIIEDLHFASREDRSAAFALARIAASHRALVVLTTRPALTGPERALLARLERARVETLPRLSARHVVDLLREFLGSDQLAAAVAGPIAHRSDGNPFFAFEMLRELEERGALTRGPDGAYVAAGDIGPIDVPSSVGGLIVARLRELSDDERRILEVGAVEGFEFDPDNVARVLERRRLDILHALSSLERRSGVVRTVGRRFQFDHHLLQEVMLGEMSSLLVAEYHSLLANAREARELEPGAAGKPGEGTLGAEAAVFIATHRLKGTAPASALPLVLPAARQLAARGRQDAALSLLRLALEPGVATAPSEIAALQQARCLALLTRGRSPEVREALDGWIAAARRIDDAAARVTSLASASSRLAEMGAFDEANRLVNDVIRQAEGVDDLAALARVAAAEASIRTRELRDAEALEALDRQVDLATRAAHDELLAIGWNNRAIVLLRAGRLAESIACGQRAVDLRLSLGDALGASNAMHGVGSTQLHLGRVEEAVATLERGIELKRESGDPWGEFRLTTSLLEGHAASGRLDLYHEGLAHLRRLAQRIDVDAAEGLITEAEGYLALLEGRVDDAVASLRRFVADAPGELETSVRVGVHVEMALILDSTGRRTEAHAEGEAAVRLARSGGARDQAHVASCSHAARLWRAGLAEEGRALVAEASRLHAPEGTVRHLLEAARVLVGLETRLERPIPRLGTLDVLLARLWLIEAGHVEPHASELRASLDRLAAHLSGDALERARLHSPIAVGLRALHCG